MSNSAIIRIDCDRNTISIESDFVDIAAIGQRQLETSKSHLVAMIAGAQIRDLMKLDKADLMERHLEVVRTQQ